MNKISDLSTWSKAFALWFWTNAGGIIGVFFSAVLFSMKNHDSPYWSGGDWIALRVIGLTSLVISLPMVPVAYGAFRQLLLIRTRSVRLLATAGAISIAFAAVLLLACTAANDVGFFFGAFSVGGWAYLLTSLVAARVLYSPALLRRDDQVSTAENDIAA